MAEKLSVKETKEVLKLVLDVVNVGMEAKNNDGKITWSDAALMIKIFPSIGPAFSDIAGVIPEMKDLSPEEAVELVAYVMAELKIGNEKATKIVEKSLKICIAAFELVLVITEKPEAVVA